MCCFGWRPKWHPTGIGDGSVIILCYINNLPQDIDSSIRVYADGAVMYRTVKDVPDQLKLQDDLNKMAQWVKTWHMIFSPSKCEYVLEIITNKIYPLVSHYMVWMHGQPIKGVSSAKYLGVIIDQTLSWLKHVSITLLPKANCTKAFLQQNLLMCPPCIKATCYQTYIQPILEYTATIWSPYNKCNITKIEKVQRQAAEIVFNDFSHYYIVLLP